MREILFRGKVKNTNEWQYGDLRHWTKKSVGIHHQELHTMLRVIPETVGQYTGLTDKNGTKIFEGDIVKATFSHNNWMQDSVEKRTATYEVRYNEKYCYFYLAKHQNNMLFDGNWNYFLREIEVIGNIHDNPELLEGGEE